MPDCMVLGIGNSLYSDDGCGPYVAALLQDSGIPAYNCGTAPENFTGVVRKQQPHLLVLVDAALMNKEPGALHIIPEAKIPDTAIGTHMLPLSHLVHYLAEAAERILVIGIQPASLEYGDRLSTAVEAAANILKGYIVAGYLEKIPEL